MKPNNSKIKCLFGYHDWESCTITDPDKLPPHTVSMRVDRCKICGDQSRPVGYVIQAKNEIS